MRRAKENVVGARMSLQVLHSQLLMKLKIFAISFEGEYQSFNFFVRI
jgi:hypothetical protein